MPLPAPAPAAAGSAGSSATAASVVVISAATLEASCSAVRTTFVGSMMPALIMSQYVPVAAS